MIEAWNRRQALACYDSFTRSRLVSIVDFVLDWGVERMCTPPENSVRLVDDIFHEMAADLRLWLVSAFFLEKTQNLKGSALGRLRRRRQY